jgi:hypothetical protein
LTDGYDRYAAQLAVKQVHMRLSFDEQVTLRGDFAHATLDENFRILEANIGRTRDSSAKGVEVIEAADSPKHTG